MSPIPQAPQAFVRFTDTPSSGQFLLYISNCQQDGSVTVLTTPHTQNVHNPIYDAPLYSLLLTNPPLFSKGSPHASRCSR